MADVFISYKHEERPQVDRLASALRGLGLDVWFDASLSAGESFSNEIDREVRAARAVLVCWSPKALESEWVRAEASVGFKGKNLISTYIDGLEKFELPVPFNSIQTEDMRTWAEHPDALDPAWLSLLRRLGPLTGRADITEWGALGAGASLAQIEAWLAAHAATSPLVVAAESLLREREAGERERIATEAAARERIARQQAERAAAEALAREAHQRALAEKRARDAEARAAFAEGVARFSRRAMLWGGGVVALGGVGSATRHGLYGETPFLRSAFPTTEIRPGSPISVRLGLRLVGHERSVERATFTRDGARVVTSSGDGTVRIWDAASGREIAVLRTQGRDAHPSFSPDGVHMVAKVEDAARVWRVADGRAIATLNIQDQRVSHASFSNNNAHVFVNAGGALRVWDFAAGREVASFGGGDQSLRSWRASPDGARIVTIANEGPVRLWDRETGAQLAMLAVRSDTSLPYSILGAITGPRIEFSPDGAILIATGQSSVAQVWDAATGRQIGALAHQSMVWSAAFNRDGSKIITGCEDGTASVWDGNTGRQIKVLRIEHGSVLGASFSADGKHILTASGSEGAYPSVSHVWDSASYRVTATLTDRLDARFDPASSFVLTDHDAATEFWDPLSGRKFATLRGHARDIKSTEFGANGARLLTASEDRTACIWEIEQSA